MAAGIVNGRGPRYLVAHLPAFALERCGYTAQDVAACVADVQGATRIVALTPAARAEGLAVGMTVAEARAIVPGVRVEVQDPTGEAADRQALILAFSHFSDRVAPWGSGDLVLDVGRTASLFGGEAALAARLAAHAHALGHACRVAIADDPLAAQAIAVWGEGGVVAPGAQAEMLAGLPLAALEPTPKLSASLQALGLRDVRGWARLDPASVAGRFGPEGVRLHQIARGRAASRLPWDPPDPGPVAERVVLGAATLTLEPILFVLPGLLARMSDALSSRDALAVKVAFHLILENNTAAVLRLRVGRPTRDSAVLLRVLRARLERARLDAPVVELLIEVEEETTEIPGQPGLLDRSEATEDVGDLLGRLIENLGDKSVFGATLVSGWRPEEAWVARIWAPGLAHPPPTPHKKAGQDPVAEQRAWETEGPRPRPLRLLERPERIEVQEEGSGPTRVRLEGRWCAVDAREGPERLEGAWWREDGGFFRDYWVLEVEGSVCWVFRDDQARWSIHGWFD